MTEFLLAFVFGVTAGLAIMYALCDLWLAEPEREELHRLLRWRRAGRPSAARWPHEAN